MLAENVNIVNRDDESHLFFYLKVTYKEIDKTKMTAMKDRMMISFFCLVISIIYLIFKSKKKKKNRSQHVRPNYLTELLKRVFEIFFDSLYQFFFGETEVIDDIFCFS